MSMWTWSDRSDTGRRMPHVAKIHFLDVTNRDGVQTARTGLSKFGKTMVNFYLGQPRRGPVGDRFPFPLP